MILYSDIRSGSCRRVFTVIETLGLDVEIKTTDILKGATRSPEFLALNPGGKLPVLVDGDVVLSEASAIMLYLVEQAGDVTLAPSGAARFEMLKWMFWAAEHFRIPAPIYFEENVIGSMLMGKEPDAGRIAEADRRIAECSALLDAHLSHRQFVLGDHPSLADIDLAAPLSQMLRSHVPYQNFPNIMRWNRDLGQALPAWKRTGEALDLAMDTSLAAARQDVGEAA